ncbi:hypothetical protein E2562_038696 [Oryza meyeriana var. granulata]|uniref:Uncharacterized protein n=1 Tax=Oryza meyeriana var. granulata TaxID=110450 RepID=A0A6G1CXT1_9ORYZ|nr:hypothetical protein E2562_038696 [Oryza meyeriana var. granulata]
MLGYPDNIRRDTTGSYWVGNPDNVRHDATGATRWRSTGRSCNPTRWLLCDGIEVEELTAAKGETLSEVVESGCKLWLGSLDLIFVS